MDVESSYNVSRSNFVDTGVNGVAIHRGKLRLALIRQHELEVGFKTRYPVNTRQAMSIQSTRRRKHGKAGV